MSVRQQGGFLGIDKRVEVDDEEVEVVERGVARQIRPNQEAAERVSSLARRVAELPHRDVAEPAEPASDGMLTELEIDDGADVFRLMLSAGADAPREVWDLIAAVDECSRP